ncbi:hypothetical protein D1007_53150 [Hordeum vulgare]|nr:hypothetical protein D1007_53150 [Hordeum vulgare]
MAPAKLSWPHALFVQHLVFKATTTFISLHGANINLTESSNIVVHHSSKPPVRPTRAMAPLQNIAVALTLLIVMVEIASLPTSSAVIVKSEEAALDELTPIIKTALDGVIAAAPPSKRTKVAEAVAKQELLAMYTMNKAKGDKEKFGAHLLAYKIAAKIVTAAAPAEKFKMMEDGFTEASRPIL